MPFPEIIDFDKVTTIALSELTASLREWLDGRPTDEIALMNRITAHLNRRRRGCDVGVNNPIKMQSQLALLHRQGESQTDLYGSDLAITVSIDQLDFLKTAFFQLKKANQFEAELERKQLLETQIDSRVADRCFVLLADEARTGIRIRPVNEILKEFDSKQQTKVVNASDWTFFTQWLWGWLSCDIGPESKLKDPASVESLLQRYVVQDEWVAPWGIANEGLARGYLPTRAWLAMFFINADADLHQAVLTRTLFDS